MRDYVTVVTGMPRSGTSLMMRMLDAGGIPALTDGRRPPDQHNPGGYFEYDPVKRLAQDSSWLEKACGRALKVVYLLLPYLPPQLDYRVVFMERDLAETFESQRDLLRAKGDPAADGPADRLIPALAEELRQARERLARRAGIQVLLAPYAEVVREPAAWSHRLSDWLGGLDEAAMAAVVDPSLYHHRSGGAGV